jgi:hypothetical protein
LKGQVPRSAPEVVEEETMTQKTLVGILYPDGRLMLPEGELPNHPVRVAVTIEEDHPEAGLADLGDYLEQLTDYEERLARGEIQWQ